MSFSQTAGTAIIPTLSRIVLCIAFVAAGWSKCFKETTFDDTQAARLTELGVAVTRDGAVAGLAIRPHFELASWQDGGGAQESGETTEEASQDTTTDVDPPAVSDPPADDTSTGADAIEPTPLALGANRAKSVHRITLLVDGAGWPQPQMLAYLAAVTELLGGALLLVGLFSRVWGLGLAVAMGVAFYLTTWQGISIDMFDLSNGANIPAFNTMFSQVGLGVLAFGIFLTGPGPLSLDRRLFGRGDDSDEPVRILSDDD